ncbi:MULTISPECIES: HAD family hydrolase [Rhodobacterales]|uniref:sulfotransferase-like domain-containing protein n=1 Tax=Rhodobacterales TaxID=204455 RepID=UPI00237F6E0B|nr:HAD family hydrolase [Phaeobacter gallaeciensis]MDE4099232.1 HAD family hydrolase [Phaeobacter gallaeciensis]MDE4108139.1 HAD family hydrolase [Phaeobacter gallaeciensis]MDE4112496.1 HAD family hydrolase [Phaeobacter gallaeciensis]MDE4116967.1 HAD family hydrolase [Phaeobacter gallaeciensis]MDE4121439.1 HAD family hydrolase [Phaeobacter gallaeciensis]
MRIAMWSGPRNLSTAMMYSFGNRGDCAVVDEPFYAAYLKMTGLDHPMREEIMDSQSQDPKVVADMLIGDIPAAKPVYYQKHMSQHMIPGMPRDWMREVTNVFLIRHPARVIASYAAKRENPNLDDIGFRQQAELYELCRSWGQEPVVVDSYDIRQDPAAKLEQMCDAIGLAYSPKMLSWPKGGHKDDGVWAEVWYGAVWTSTGFAGAEGDLPEVPEHLQPVLEEAMPYYEQLKAVKI